MDPLIRDNLLKRHYLPVIEMDPLIRDILLKKQHNWKFTS